MAALPVEPGDPGQGGKETMTLTIEDRLAITDLISLHGHLTDLDSLDALFAVDVICDVRALGGGVLTGLAALRRGPWRSAGPIPSPTT